jgi:hypothetical protein
VVKNNNTIGVQKEKILTNIFKGRTYLEKIGLFGLNNLVWLLFLAFFIAFSLITPAFFSIKGILLIFFVSKHYNCLSYRSYSRRY